MSTQEHSAQVSNARFPKLDIVPNKSLWLTIIVPILLAVPLAFITEALTLKGSPLSSPFNPSDWNLGRVGIYFLIQLVLCEIVSLAIYDGRFDYLVSFWSKDTYKNAKRAGVEIIGGALLFLVSRFVLSAILPGMGISSWRFPLIGAICLVALVLIAVHFKAICHNHEWAFLIIALSYGIILCFSVPPTTFTYFDDGFHYDGSTGLSYLFDAQYSPANAAAASTKNPAEMAIKNIPTAPSEIPVGIDDATYDKVVQTYNDLTEQGEYKQLEGLKRLRAGNWNRINSIGHVPNAIGLWIGRLFSDSFEVPFVCAKLSGLLFYVLIFFFAIRHLKSGKLIAATIALIPTSLYIATSFTYDAVNISLIGFSVCYFLGEAQRPNKPIGIWETLTIALTFLVGMLIKAVFFPVALVFLLMPSKKFHSTANRVAYYLFVVAAFGVGFYMIASTITSILASTTNLTDARGGTEVNAKAQVEYILSDPMGYFIQTTKYIFGQYINPLVYTTPFSVEEPHRYTYFFYYRWIEDVNGGAYEFYRPVVYAWLFTILGWCVVDRTETDKSVAGPLGKVLSFAAVFISLFGAASALYITFTPVGSTEYAGMHNRYVYPALMPLFLIFFNFGRIVKVPKHIRGIAFIVITALLLIIEFNIVFLHRL